jgi:hypothetical protein
MPKQANPHLPQTLLKQQTVRTKHQSRAKSGEQIREESDDQKRRLAYIPT